MCTSHITTHTVWSPSPLFLRTYWHVLIICQVHDMDNVVGYSMTMSLWCQVMFKVSYTNSKRNHAWLTLDLLNALLVRIASFCLSDEIEYLCPDVQPRNGLVGWHIVKSGEDERIVFKMVDRCGQLRIEWIQKYSKEHTVLWLSSQCRVSRARMFLTQNLCTKCNPDDTYPNTLSFKSAPNKRDMLCWPDF